MIAKVTIANIMEQIYKCIQCDIHDYTNTQSGKLLKIINNYINFDDKSQKKILFYASGQIFFLR